MPKNSSAMHYWTIVVGLVVLASGLVKSAPSGPTLIKYYDEEISEPQPRPVRTPLRIVAQPDRGSKNYYSVDKQPSTNNELYSVIIPHGGVPIVNSGPQRLQPVAPHRQYLEQKVTKIQPVPVQHYNDNQIKPVFEEPETDPIKISLSASPLRLLPLVPASFDTVRNEVQSLKLKQNKYFGQSDYVDEYVEPVNTKAVNSELVTKVTPSVQYNYETSYGNHQKQWPLKSKAALKKKSAAISKSSYKLDGISDRKLTIDRLAKLDKYRLKSDESSSSESDSDSSSSEEDDSNSSSSEEDSSEENKGAGKEDSDEDDKKSITHAFPVNYYSQTRNQALTKHTPAPLNDLRVQEKINTKKTNIVYSEQGYNDKSYDSGKYTKLYEVRQRYRRDLRQPTEIDVNEEYVAEIEALPIPLALEKVTNNSDLDGQGLLTYIQEVIKNSSKYLPDEGPEQDDNHFTSFLLNPTEIKTLFALGKTSDSLPEATDITSSTQTHIPSQTIPASALRYAESPVTFPHSSRSYYESKHANLCDESDPNLDPEGELSEIEASNNNSKKRSSKNRRRLKYLDKKIECLKSRLFGKDPLDHPLFKEESVRASSSDISFNGETGKINPKLLRSLDHSANPSINVYDDVISNIRSAIDAEHANVKDRNQMEILKLKPKAIDAESSESSNVNQTVVSVLPPPINHISGVEKDGIFDISKFLPRVYYEPKDGVLYAVRYKKKKQKNRKKKNSSKNRSFRNRYPDVNYTVFPPSEPNNKPNYFDKITDIDVPSPYSYRRPPKIPKSQLPEVRQLSSGYYPYPALAARKKRFHYELLRNAH